MPDKKQIILGLALTTVAVVGGVFYYESPSSGITVVDSGTPEAIAEFSKDSIQLRTPAKPVHEDDQTIKPMGKSNLPPPDIKLACVGVEHFSGYSTIKVCYHLKNIHTWGGDLGESRRVVMNAENGRPPGEPKDYISQETTSDGFKTGECATFTIDHYGHYSGHAGGATASGSFATDWDIDVTSAPQVCKL